MIDEMCKLFFNIKDHFYYLLLPPLRDDELRLLLRLPEPEEEDLDLE
jgi:hypothetical protein